MSDCKTPGLCECADMARCPSCGYTQHDQDYWLDHSHCANRKFQWEIDEWIGRSQQAMTKEQMAEYGKHGGAQFDENGISKLF